MMGEKVEAEPQEKEDVMISTTFLVIMIKHQWLSPRGWLYRGGTGPKGAVWTAEGRNSNVHRCPSAD